MFLMDELIVFLVAFTAVTLLIVLYLLKKLRQLPTLAKKPLPLVCPVAFLRRPFPCYLPVHFIGGVVTDPKRLIGAQNAH